MTSYRSRFLPVYFIVWFSDFEILLDLGVQWIFILEHRLFNGPVDLESCIFRFTIGLYGPWILNPWFVVGCCGSWILNYDYVIGPCGVWILNFHFVIGSYRSWILNFDFVAGSWGSWLLYFDRGTCLPDAHSYAFQPAIFINYSSFICDWAKIKSLLSKEYYHHKIFIEGHYWCFSRSSLRPTRVSLIPS